MLINSQRNTGHRSSRIWARTALVAVLLGPHALFAQSGADQQLVVQQSDEETEVREFVEAACRIQYVSWGVAFLHSGRAPNAYLFEDSTRVYEDAMQCARRLARHPELLKGQLQHDNPRVRLMAAWGLYQLSDPHWLPTLGALVGDKGSIPQRMATTNNPFEWTTADYEDSFSKQPELQTTVGDQVRHWLGRGVWDAPSPDGDLFDDWCKLQQELTPTVACLRVMMRLATGGVGNTSHWGPPQPLLKIFYAAGRAPQGAAEIAQIALFWDKYQDLEVTLLEIESQLEFDARRLGRDNVLRLLQGVPPLIDGEPLAGASYIGFEDGFARFVLDRPGRIGLMPSDGDLLLKLGRTTERVAFFRAAARLKPAEALPILSEAIERADLLFYAGFESAKCALLLWELQPDQGADFLVEWFYSNEYRCYPSHRQQLAEELLNNYRPRDRRMFARLVADPRFAATEPSALESILRILNRMEHAPIVDRPELSNIRHPFGIDRAFSDLEKAGTQYPEQTAVLVATLTTWRLAISQYVGTWQ